MTHREPIKNIFKAIQLLPCTLFLSLNAAHGQESDGFPNIKFDGLIDVRAALASNAEGWLEGGLGKTRYGRGESSLDIAEASLIIMPRLNYELSSYVHLAYAPEQFKELDVVEAFVNYRPVSTTANRYDVKVGMFFPPVSLEHTDVAWTSPYTVTPSAINSWIGEEVKTTGIELSLEHRMELQTLTFTAAGFIANDPVGSLIAWRGWALHDVKSTADGRFPLAPIPAISPTGNLFTMQAPFVEPHHEIDDRVGYYAGLHWDYDGWLTVQGIHYDNRGSSMDFQSGQYAFDTQFSNIGFSAFLPNDMELLGQYLWGESRMGGTTLDYTFDSYYLMLSRVFQQQRVSLRFDDFGSDDKTFVLEDNNNEDGWALTAAYTFEISNQHKLMAEILYVSSDRPGRSDLRLAPEEEETQLQISYRYSF
jgi:hypothetical protein